MKVNFLDLKAQYYSIKNEIDDAIHQVLERTAFAAGPFVKSFEEHFAERHQSKYCIGVNSGTAALHAALMALDIKAGDQVIVPANTFFATPESVSLTGATPVFVDCDPDYYNMDVDKIEAAITPKTKAVIAVHLYGQPARIDAIKRITDQHKLFLIEDCAQAHLSTLNGKFVGTFGIMGCWSFYPGKNLGAYGEGGAVTTDDAELYKKIMMIRDHGMPEKYHHEIIGHNYRLEGIQGAVLDVKLKHLDQWTAMRRHCAELYRKYLKKVPQITLPKEMPDAKHVYHLFVIRTPRRDELQAFLNANQIYTGIHYPIPCHLQNAYKTLGYKKGDFPVTDGYAEQLLSLPMSEQLKEEEIAFVAEMIIKFFE
ncbi:MAG: DegT/DnrJ/EryC1/StrS family aminotransferase [Calditrichaeota bacterium]|nr:MAG: DegT/DnrJ/EryC1/StrS family aminotransferase [Calditrichota bacterium]